MAQKIRLKDLERQKLPKNRDAFEKRLQELQFQMLLIQQTYFHEKRRAIIVFEGWDSAGKGGTIRRLTEKLDPRGFHVWPIGPPRPDEQGRHYLYRFWRRLPEPGLLAIFDRSWYGRVLVERVEHLIPKPVWKRAYREINEFERMLVDDGVRLIKIFLHITPEEQLRRFAKRLETPYKRWKLTANDIRNHRRWPDYVEAIEDMFDETSTDVAPWTALFAETKWVGRTQALEVITKTLAKGIDVRPPPIDPEVKKLGGLKYLLREMKKIEEEEKRQKQKKKE
ncbi:MAG TPA: polyphosphate kinase [Alphaproteobacteria bacterium]